MGSGSFEPVELDFPRSDLDTPSLVVDADRFERNARAMSEAITRKGVRWRPHVKAHRSPYLARIQLAAGADGITCGSLGEAEAFVESGLTDILLANVLGSETKWRRVTRLQRRARVIACLDDAVQVANAGLAAASNDTIQPLYIEVDVGLCRAGVRSVEAVGALAVRIAEHPNLELAGVMGYEGHCMKLWPHDTKAGACRAAVDILIEARDALVSLGISVNEVSCGGTGTYTIVAGLPGVTEIQAGGGCLLDVLYVDVFNVSGLEHAVSVEAEVISRPTSRRMVTNAGLKAVAAHPSAMPRTTDGLTASALSSEHATFETAGEVPLPGVGKRVSLYPGRVDTTTYLYDQMFLARGERVVGLVPLVRAAG